MITVDNNYEICGDVYRRTISDANLMIRKVGTDEVYSEAVDLSTSDYVYEETENEIEIYNDEYIN